MKNILIVYDTVSGSTGEIGEIIRNQLQVTCRVESKRVADVASIAAYDAVIIGSPMRFGGFASNIKKFIGKYRTELANRQVVYFFSILYIVQISEEAPPASVPYVDPTLAMKTITKDKASGMDKTHSLAYYDKTIAKCAPEIKPLSVAYFKGRLVLSSLPILTRILMKVITMLTTKEQEGDFLNRESVGPWAASLTDVLK